mgnify:CR=1 FL=1
MARHSDLYRLIEPVPELRSGTGEGPVLVHGLEGFSDAGHAVHGATSHLRETLDSQLLVEFDADELVDYRSRRPRLRYSFDHFAGYTEPEQVAGAYELDPGDLIAAFAKAISKQLDPQVADLGDLLDTLSEREAGVVSMRFGLTDGQPKTLDEIGKVYGVTRERIRQIESKTMSKLRHPSRSQVLRDYLD